MWNVWLHEVSISRNDCHSCTLEQRQFCDLLDFLWIGSHTFLAEYGAIECDFRTLYLSLSAIKYTTIVTGYLH